ncbi:UbiD family decarboxylase [Malonomonas rubra]|uniref:UbiD family decarboxylase n=1 Tax=Malonomonas rubra TaxID=57040 RepID=UPI0026E93AA4|nr:UbiD family decarboxylase [Malonomonas rubra]
MDLSAFLELLQQQNELHQITATVSCDLELAALSRLEFSKPGGGKALLFSQLQNTDISGVTNLFGSQKRLLNILRCKSTNQLAARFKSALLQVPVRLGSKREIVCASQSELSLVHKIKLTDLPAIRSWPGEKGRYLTLALTVTADPEGGAINLGLYRAEIVADNKIALNFAPKSGAGRHLQAASKLGKNLPVALFLGGDPAYLYSAAAPLPAEYSEFDFSAAAFGTENRFVSCYSQNLVVPVTAELVIEGYIDPSQRCQEGPFGNHTGQYVSRKDCPLLQVTAIAKKSEPILPITVVGPPPSENVNLGKANEILVGEMLKIDYPQIIDLQMPLETIFHGVSLISVRHPEQNANRELIDALWHNSPLKQARLLVLLDEDIELGDRSQCWWRCINLLNGSKIYQDRGRIAIDATGVDLKSLVREDRHTKELLKNRMREYNF